MIEKGTEFLSYYIQMIINYSGGIGFENYRERIANVNLWKRQKIEMVITC